MTFQFQRGDRIEEASRQSSQTTIAQPGIGFHFLDLVQIDAKFFAYCSERLIQRQVGQVIAEGPTNQKFHRHVI